MAITKWAVTHVGKGEAMKISEMLAIRKDPKRKLDKGFYSGQGWRCSHITITTKTISKWITRIMEVC